MPAPPELADRLSHVRPAEVLGQAHAEHSSEPDPHVGIPGEPVVHLHRQADQPQPRHERTELRWSQRERQVGLPAGQFGHDEDLPGANEKAPHPERVIAETWPAMREVWRHTSVGGRATDDHGQEHQVDAKLASAAVCGAATAVHVDEVRDAMKREIRDTEWNNPPGNAPERAGDRAGAEDRRNHRDVRDHGYDEPRQLSPAAGTLDRERDPVREQHEGDEERRKQRSARKKREGKASGAQKHGLVEGDAALRPGGERNNEKKRREEDRNEDREPDGTGEEHAQAMLSCSLHSGKETLIDSVRPARSRICAIRRHSESLPRERRRIRPQQ